ncbi:MAG TPA: uroporphyrinogen-III synthase [Blastocatellia bacterium]|nr:uroporphyrinogen-III synthase [Blastocatellia bacterium]
MSGELANLMQRHGSTVLQAPALKEASVEASNEVAELIERLQTKAITHIVVQTGVGVAGLLNEAEKLNRKDELIALLQAATIIARGPKPLAVLSRNGIKANVTTSEPHTTAELIAACKTIDLTGQTVAVLHYGERNAQLAAALQTQGATLFELCLYEWQLPENLEPLRTMIAETIAGRVDAVAFTSQVQARHLFHVAEESGQADELRLALQTKTTVASIGPTCSDALRALGIAPQIEPEHPKMGFLVIAMQEYFA